jgi:hypothetical protein
MKVITNSIDETRALDILQDAFADVPGVTWMVENCRNEKAALRKLLSFCFHASAEKKGAFLTADRNGVVFFYHLERKPLFIKQFFRSLYLTLAVIGIRRSIEIAKTRRIIDSLRPRSGWYGWFLATAKDKAGVQAAYEIKRDMFQIADASNESIYVETTVPRISLLYKRIGFYEYARVKHPFKDNLEIWLMRRDPQSVGKSYCS